MMKKIFVSFLVVLLLVGCSSSNSATSDASELFARYEGMSFISIRVASDFEKENINFSQDYSIVNLFRVMDSKKVSKTYFNGKVANDVLSTYEYFTNKNNRLSNSIDTIWTYDSFVRIADTEFFTFKSAINEEKNTINSMESIFWFTGEGDTAHLYWSTVGSQYDVPKSVEDLDIKEVTDLLKEMALEDAHHITEYDVFDNVDTDELYTLFLSTLKNAPVLPDTIGLGTEFAFDDLLITLNSISGWSKVENRFSDKNGADVFFVDVSVKNTRDTLHGLNMFHYDIYGPDGTETRTVSTYFDNTIDFAGDMLSGGTQTAIMPIEYRGDGIYTIIFNNYSENVAVTFEVTK